jgi:hypothetical protein
MDAPGYTAADTQLGIGSVDNGFHVRLIHDIPLHTFNRHTISFCHN